MTDYLCFERSDGERVAIRESTIQHIYRGRGAGAVVIFAKDSVFSPEDFDAVRVLDMNETMAWLREDGTQVEEDPTVRLLRGLPEMAPTVRGKPE